MDKNLQLVLLIAGIILLILALLICFKQLHNSLLRKKGKLSFSRVSKYLHKFASIRGFRVIDNLQLKNGDETVTIDHVLVGFFGVLLLTNVNVMGSVYGDYKDDQWISIVLDNDNHEKSKTVFDNPVRIAEKCNEAVRKLFAANNLYKISSEGYVVFGDPKVQLANLKKKNGMPLMNFKQLKKLLSKDKYSADGPVDVKAICDLLTGNAAE